MRRYQDWLGESLIELGFERYAEQATYTAFESERLQPGAPRMLYIGVQGRWPETRP